MEHVNPFPFLKQIIAQIANISKPLLQFTDFLSAKNSTPDTLKVCAVPERKMSLKRQDYLGWEDYFMGVALLAAQRSKDPKRQVGACIVNEDNKIVGVGYNGFPKYCSDDEFPWGKGGSSLNDKKYYVCHAELNAILNSFSSTKGCRVYVTLYPCNECAKSIIQSGIKEVIFLEPWRMGGYEATRWMFSSSGVRTRLYTPGRETVVLNFKKSDDEIPSVES